MGLCQYLEVRTWKLYEIDTLCEKPYFFFEPQYIPQNWPGNWTWRLGGWCSFSKRWFSGSMFVFSALTPPSEQTLTGRDATNARGMMWFHKIKKSAEPQIHIKYTRHKYDYARVIGLLATCNSDKCRNMDFKRHGAPTAPARESVVTCCYHPKLQIGLFLWYVTQFIQEERVTYVFPERLGEGRFLGAMSLSSMTWLAWLQLA